MLAIGMPMEAMPAAEPRGKKSYTIKATSGAVIEVQHDNAKFYIKRAAGNVPLGAGILPSVNWRVCGPASAWSESKRKAGTPNWEPKV